MADAIVFALGRLGATTAGLHGAPARAALVSTSDWGALLTGTSSSAIEPEPAIVDVYGDDGPRPLQALSWQPFGAARLRGTDEGLDNLCGGCGATSAVRASSWRRPRPPGWETAEVLDPGEHDVGAWC
jgi:hypothetical protein